jgi:hypothetical protein
LKVSARNARKESFLRLIVATKFRKDKAFEAVEENAIEVVPRRFKKAL